MHAITNLFIVTTNENSTHMAERWVAEFNSKREEMYAAIEDTPASDACGIVRAMIDINIHKGLALRNYQKHVLETYSYYMMHSIDDELMEDIINGTEPPDIHDIIELLRSFETSSTEEYDVVSIVPLDLKGTMGYVIQPKLK